MPFPSPCDLSDSEMERVSCTGSRFFTTEPPGIPVVVVTVVFTITQTQKSPISVLTTVETCVVPRSTVVLEVHWIFSTLFIND